MIKICSLFSGSSGNAIFIKTERSKILIDAGLSGKRITEALCSIGENPLELSAILVSHEHSDHIRGAGIISRKFNIPIYANENTWVAMEHDIGPIDIKNKLYFTTENEFEIGDVSIKAFSIPHDAADPVGFNFFANNKKLTIATDIGHITKGLLEYFVNSDLLFLESNHDIEMLKVGPYPWNLKKRILGENGHLSNEMAGKVITYIAEKGTKKFILGHLSRENNFPELAYQTVYNALYEKNIHPGIDVSLEVAMRDRTGSVIEV
ncbi:MAG: MBL fold metallo-hydrolase [Clostridia bacterium]|nr:MBL fold metallo-hydrolase [Clostridia bacterium]